MHLYSAWLPPPLAEQVPDEQRQFSALVQQLQSEWQPDDTSSRVATVEAIPIIKMFLKAKSEPALSDLEALSTTGLKLILCSTDNLDVQTRWGSFLEKILRKYRHKLTLKIDWRPLYDLLMNAHFERRHSYEGYNLRREHLEAMLSLIEICRRFFPVGSASEIWNEFRFASVGLENVAQSLNAHAVAVLMGPYTFFNYISHNSSLEAMGFLSLLLPSPLQRTAEVAAFYTSTWFQDCLNLWDALPHSNYWSIQWACLIGRCIKHRANTSVDFEPFLCALFMRYLRTFEVPVGRCGSRSPIYRTLPREVFNAFCSPNIPLPAAVARSIVYLLSPGSAVQTHIETLINLLEQFYHPSNGGSWTSSLEIFLRHLVYYFMKRIACEQQMKIEAGDAVDRPQYLGRAERAAFVKAIMILIKRGHYSKSTSLAGTAVDSASKLMYLEPLLVLPHIVSCFKSAMDTTTATHQLQSSLTGLALSARALLLASARQADLPPLPVEVDNPYEGFGSCIGVTLLDCQTTLVNAMFNTLLGLDANDPPKTMATLQLYASVLYTVRSVDNLSSGHRNVFPIDWALWIEGFFPRLFVLLQNLEPSFETDSENGFLMEGGSMYSPLLLLLFGKAAPSLYEQALKIVSKFVLGNILPGAVKEIGMLCYCAVFTDPVMALPVLVKPLMNSVILFLADAPSTGFGTSALNRSSDDTKVGLSLALEKTVVCQLVILSQAVMRGGAALPPHKELLKEVIAAAFNAPNSKVNEAGMTLLGNAIGSLVKYWPLDLCSSPSNDGEDGLEQWWSTTGRNAPKEGTGPVWHLPSNDEMSCAEELLALHLRGPLADLRAITKDSSSTKFTGQETKDRLRVTLLRMEGCMLGAGSCLPDFEVPPGENVSGAGLGSFTVAGAAGSPIGTAALREEIADALHLTCEFILKDRADDTILLKLLVRLMDFVANYGGGDHDSWFALREEWQGDAKIFYEPRANLITCPDPRVKRRPWLMMVEKSRMILKYRAARSHYHRYLRAPKAPKHVTMLLKDLMTLALGSYHAVRLGAADKVTSILKRHPALITECIPVLTASLQDAKAKEETVLGACNVLRSKPVMLFLMQDWNALAKFCLSLLCSSHHETLKAQNAITELFFYFNYSYGGVPLSSYTNFGSKETSYGSMISRIQGQVGPGAAHWRYNLMANGMLLFLVLPPSSDSDGADADAKLRESMAGGFFANLQSELPALRPFSVLALLFLLRTTPKGMSLRSTILAVMQGEGFGDKIVDNLAGDHHYLDGQNSYSSPQVYDLGLTVLMPTFMREWPCTRTWDSSDGEAFASTFATMFQYLAQECGEEAMDVLRDPLEDACGEVEDRGKQCIAAEIMAGLLHSNDESVIDEWDEFLCPLLRTVLRDSTMESAAEWAACVRFAVGGGGKDPPALRHKILLCLGEPLPEEAATSLLTKRLTLLNAVLNELGASTTAWDAVDFQIGLLKEVTGYMSHLSPQVRQGVGRMICIICANLERFSIRHVVSEGENPVKDCVAVLVKGAEAAATKIRMEGHEHSGKASTSLESYSPECREAVRWMETVLNFIIASVRSGNDAVLVKVLVELLHPLLSLQDTWNKELEEKANTAIIYLWWQLFATNHLGAAVSALLAASKDGNWHTREATLKYLQPLVYRHTYILTSTDLEALWERVQELLSDPRLEVREGAAETLTGMMKGGGKHAEAFRKSIIECARSQLSVISRRKKASSRPSAVAMHGVVLGISACVLSVPYDVPRWLPETVVILARFIREPWPVKATVTKTISDFWRTHMDTWDLQKGSFTEDQLEILSDVPTSTSYFA